MLLTHLDVMNNFGDDHHTALMAFCQFFHDTQQTFPHMPGYLIPKLLV